MGLKSWPKPIFIEDQKPPLHESVLLESDVRFVVGYYNGTTFYAEQDGVEFFPQYWRPLPELNDN